MAADRPEAPGRQSDSRPVPEIVQQPTLRDLIHWRRIGRGLDYARRHGLMAVLRRLFPQLRTYRGWVQLHDTLGPEEIAAIERDIRLLANRPLISILVPIGPADERLVQRAIDGMATQLYPHWELCFGADPLLFDAVTRIAAARDAEGGLIKVASAKTGASVAARANAALAAAAGTLVALVGAGDRLAPHALYRLALDLEAYPDAALLYSDEDTIDRGGRRRDPWFKTDWNPDLLLGQDMVGRLAAYRRDLIVRLGGWRDGFDDAAEHDLALRAGENLGPGEIRHIPQILYHRSEVARGDTPTAEPHCRAVADHLARLGVAGSVEPLAGRYVRVRRALPDPKPGVSFIVPTRDRVELLRCCVDGLLTATDYDPLEVIIVDNDSAEAATREYFAGLAAEKRVRVVSYTGPFNYSAINNFAVGEARHPILALLNNDIEVIHADWLCEMVSHAVRPEVGAVGAKLYYPDDTIQHAGTIVGLGGAAGHPFRGFGRAAPGYCGRLLLTQNLSAATAACLVLRREVYEEVGGFDAVNLPVAFNDVDLCLRIRERGYLVVWTPFAELYHRESASRGSDYDADKIGRFTREITYLKERWGPVIAHDPYYNPNLTVQRLDFSLAFPPRIPNPKS